MSDAHKMETKTDAASALPSSHTLFSDAYDHLATGAKAFVSVGQGMSELNQGVVMKCVEMNNAFNQLQINTLKGAWHMAGDAASGVGHLATGVAKEAAKENPEMVKGAQEAKQKMGESYEAGKQNLKADYSAVVHHAGETYDSAKTNIKNTTAKTHDFVTTRPLTASLEAAVPVVGPALVMSDALHRGGLHKDSAIPTQEAAKPSAEAAKPVASAEPAKHEAEKSASVKAGEGYWQVAKRALGGEASNADILKESNQLQALNNHKALNPGDLVVL